MLRIDRRLGLVTLEAEIAKVNARLRIDRRLDWSMTWVQLRIDQARMRERLLAVFVAD